MDQAGKAMRDAALTTASAKAIVDLAPQSSGNRLCRI